MLFLPVCFFRKTGSFFILIFFLSQVDSHAQPVIKGWVFDTDKKPLAFVSATLYQGGTLVSGTSTNESGLFVFHYQLKKDKQYSIQLSLVGYTDTSVQIQLADSLSLFHFVLQKDSKLISTVTVTARQPLVSRKPDRNVINIESSFLSVGLSALEVLQKSPGIWVNSNGIIQLRGNQPVRVMIDDMVLQLPGEELSIYLSSLKSEDISKIEVISNPPSEYEAAGAGGIIRILLKKGARRGLNGSAYIQYRYRTGHPLFSAGTSLNVKLKNVYLSAGYGFRKDDRLIKESTGIVHPDLSSFKNQSDRLEDFTSHQFRLGVSAEPGRGKTIGIETLWSNVTIQQDFNTGVQYHTSSNDITGNAITNKKRKFKNGTTVVNYSWKTDIAGSLIRIIAEYSRYNKLDTQLNKELYSSSIPAAFYRYRLPFATEIYNAQADYTKKLRYGATLKTGIKQAFIKRDNTVYREDYLQSGWAENVSAGNRFIYKERLLMLYAELEKRIKGFNVKGGLRFEQTTSIGNSVTSSQQFRRTYSGLFPSLFLQHYFNEHRGSSIYLNYSRRINRPSLSDLNPYRFVYNNYITLTGNPAILPEYAHSISTGLVLLNDYAADFYFTQTKNVITLSARAGDDNRLDYLSQNVNGSTEMGISLAVPFTVVKGWRMNNNGTLGRLRYQFEGVQVAQTTYSVKTIHTLTLKNNFNVDLAAEYQSSRRYSNIYTAGVFYIDLGLQKKILKNKVNLQLMLADIFNSTREKEITNTGNTTITFFRKRQTRSLQLNFTYNFKSGKKFQNNKIDEGNQEERNRSGN